MSASIRISLAALGKNAWKNDVLSIHPIADDYDLWYATVECRLAPGQDEFVNPAGFSIGRAYLAPEDNVPCIISLSDGTKVGYIVFRKWFADDSFSWSFYLDRDFQGKGLGKAAAQLAINILRAADASRDIKLSCEAANTKAQRLYTSVGFTRTDELDGDDIVYKYR